MLASSGWLLQLLCDSFCANIVYQKFKSGTCWRPSQNQCKSAELGLLDDDQKRYTSTILQPQVNLPELAPPVSILLEDFCWSNMAMVRPSERYIEEKQTELETESK